MMDEKMANVYYVQNCDGTQLPAIGFGTYMTNAREVKGYVLSAIDAGYRHIDTAYFNRDEAEVGAAIHAKIGEGLITRADVYVTTKLWCHFHEPERVEYACRKSLANLSLDYVDLYLMQWPFAYAYRGDDVLTPTNADGQVDFIDIDYLDTWRAMEQLVELGLTKSIGVANFNAEQLTRLLANCKIKPVHNQIEFHPALNQKQLVAMCKQHKIVVTGYCSLLMKLINDDLVKEIANKHQKTPSQVLLRYQLEIGVVPVLKEFIPSHIVSNFHIFDFQLDAADHEALDTLNTGHRLVRMEHAMKSKYYPFHEDI